MKVDLSNEKFSNNWKNKLEDVAGLQHAALQNKDVAWEKLQARLENKPQKKRVAWYWVAAACILIAASIPFFTTHLINDTAQQSPSINNNKKSFTIKKEPVKNIASEPSLNNQSKKQLQQSIITKADNEKLIMADSANNTGFTNNTQQPENKNIILPVMNDTSSIAGISAINNQNKLKVVHVNELGEPVEFPADIAHSSDLHLFQLKLAQQEIYNASSIATNNNSVLSLKPKNFPK